MKMETIFAGGVVAIGVDSSSEWLIVVSHSGRGVFSLKTGERIARDPNSTYPNDGRIQGIGPISSQTILVKEEYSEKEIILFSPNGRYKIVATSDHIEITDLKANN